MRGAPPKTHWRILYLLAKVLQLAKIVVLSKTATEVAIREGVTVEDFRVA
jgi:hypothetical protein